MINNILWVDTETGGLEAGEHSLLTVSFIAYIDGAIVDEKEWKIKHDTYHVTAGALKVNEIDLVEHDNDAVDEKTALFGMIDFIDKNFGYWDQGIHTLNRPYLGGHNAGFDREFLNRLFRGKKEFEKHVSHRTVDTMAIILGLMAAGLIEEDIAGSSKAFKYFGIEVEGRHTARGDNLATVALFEKLIQVMRGEYEHGSKQVSSGSFEGESQRAEN